MRVREGWSWSIKYQIIVSVLEVGQNKEIHEIQIAEIIFGQVIWKKNVEYSDFTISMF
jgi:hypothetical protein